MDRVLGAAGTNAAAIGFDKLGQVGALYHGLEVLGGGSILTGLILGATAGDAYWGEAVRREDYRSPEYPGHADA